MTPYLEMALNNAWANATLYGAMAELDDAAFAAPRPGFFPSLSHTMNHIHEVDLYYIDALEEGGLGRAVYDRAPVPSVAALAALQSRADLRLASFCQRMTASDAARRVRTERSHDPEVTEQVGSLLLHIFQHQIHHCGQVHAMLAGTDIPRPQLDEFFLRQDGPLRADEMRALGLDRVF